jgi:hypothetical protein
MGGIQSDETFAMPSCHCGCIANVGRRGFIASALAASVTLPRAFAAEPTDSALADSALADSALADSALADSALIDDLVAANRILYEQGVVDGFGHVSARHDKDPSRYFRSRIMAPALVTAADIMEFDLDKNHSRRHWARIPCC